MSRTSPRPSTKPHLHCVESLRHELLDFREFGKATESFTKTFSVGEVPYFVNEYWTSRQRVSHPLHQISYRACFKAELPHFFITRLTQAGDKVYDPFMGRGTTLLESALMDRIPVGCDINPLSRILCEPRLNPPSLEAVQERLEEIPLITRRSKPKELLVFYHPQTLQEICALRAYLLEREEAGVIDETDKWIRMVATNRLTGHSTGFFSVYTMPPNQAVSVKSQQKINTKREQTPPRRDVRMSILRKSKSLLSKGEAAVPVLRRRGKEALFLQGSAAATSRIESGSIQLVVTSPPFLNVVNYKTDNWLRCWFNGIDPDKVPIWHHCDVEEWQAAMGKVFRELHRVLKPGGFVAFEVGEVRNGAILLEDLVVPVATEAGLHPEAILINDQKFTKTSNCWGVHNLQKGTNTNRIVLLSKAA